LTEPVGANMNVDQGPQAQIAPRAKWGLIK